MKSNLPRKRSTAEVESSVTTVLTAMMGREVVGFPIGLQAAGLDPAGLVLGLLGAELPESSDLIAADPLAIFPEAAKRKVVEEDEDADDDDDDTDDDEEEDEDEEELEEDEDLDDDEEEDDDEDEEEEDDEFDDPDDDDDYDDDDDEDDFDDDE